jgi:hypothetical protein
MDLSLRSNPSLLQKGILALLAVSGFIFVIISTSRYGPGLTPDSVAYIATARNIVAGVGVITYDHTPLIEQPPIFPATLAVVSLIFHWDPTVVARVVNALLFGFVIFLSGFLAFRRLYFSSPVFAYLAAMAVLVSAATIQIAVTVWSELLFASFVLLVLLFSKDYSESANLGSLLVLSFLVAITTLTRYIGVTLIPVVALQILITGKSFKTKISHLILFVILASLPLGLWLLRNYSLTGTLVGPRTSSIFTLERDLQLTRDTIVGWYFPEWMAAFRYLLMILIIAAGIWVALKEDRPYSIKSNFLQISPIVSFILIYTAFLIISARLVAFDQIGDRLLSPIYVPATLILLFFVDGLFHWLSKRTSLQSSTILSLFITAVWLVYPARTTVANALDRIKNGAGGYNTSEWRESSIIHYLLDHSPVEGCAIYSNVPYVLYILANLDVKWSPAKYRYNSYEIANELSALQDHWPPEAKACLIWFSQVYRRHLFPLDELNTITNFEPVVQLDDGAIYLISKK